MEWLALSADSNCLSFWKEILPTGDYWKEEEKLAFSIGDDTLDHLTKTFKEYTEGGNVVPLFGSHKDEDRNSDEQARLGTVKALDIRERSNGKKSLFSLIEFPSAKERDIATKQDVSVFIPPNFVDGKGVHYKRPLRHVAVTSVPVIPGLSDYEVIAASFVDSTPKSKEIKKVDDLLKMLGLEVDGDDTAKAEAVAGLVKSLQTKIKELEDAAKPKEGGSDSSKPTEPAVAASFELPALVLSQLVASRNSQIDSLVTQKRIEPAQADQLRKEYCTQENVKLCLSMSEGDSPFEQVIKALNMVEPKKSESGETLTLSHNGGEGESSLISSARKMAEAAKK